MPYDEREEETGQFQPSFSDEEFLEAVETVDPATTSAVADAVGCEYRTAYERLNRLEDDGRVSSQEVGNSFVWSTTEG